jgi:hypothetical protein
MKNRFFIILLFIVVGGRVAAQKMTVPQAVTEAFNAKFPGVAYVKWGKENAKEYEAEFKWNKIPVSANFGVDGSWRETETAVQANEIPVAIINAIQAKYPSAIIGLVEKIETPAKTYYEAAIKFNGRKKEVELTPDGKFI